MNKYIIDPLHSDIEFKIKHLMISSVRGRFNSFRAGMSANTTDFSDANLWCEIDVESIYTSISERDTHLRSPDFFDVEKHPLITFKSSDILIVDDEYTIMGDFTVKGVTKPITLKGAYNGSDVDHYGQEKFGFELTGKIKRTDWDLTFNVAGGRNTMVIGDDVKIELSIQMVKES
jgi:polyisoprenoid-binding protein YceI